MKAPFVLALVVALAAPAARADLPAGDIEVDKSAGDVSFHGGFGISLPIVPSVQLQLEGRSWLAGVELAGGLGAWGLSTLLIGKVGYVSSVQLHPYFAVGAGFGAASDLDELGGSGFALTLEAGLLIGKERARGRIMPFVELPIATWTAHDGEGRSWSPGVGYPLFGPRFLL